MCGRFTNEMTWSEIHALYSIHDYGPPPSNMPPRYNVAPTQSVNFARLDEAGKMELDYGRWWLVPFFAKQLPLETVENGSVNYPLKRKTCAS